MIGWRTIVALAGASLSAAVAAQDYMPAPPQLEGELTAADSVDAQGRRYDEYAVELGGGNVMMVMAAPAPGSRAEPVIEIYDAGGGARLARDGRSGGDSEARLLFTARERGVYRVRVVAGSAASGRYTLGLRRGPATQGPGSVLGGVAGGTIARPSTSDQPQNNAAPLAGPRLRFIICPGHPRCPR